VLSRKSNRPVSVLIVDDHPMYAETLEILLGADPRIQVIGHAYDGDEGVERAVTLQPDVVVMDVQMPRMDGIEATRLIRKQLRSTSVVVVTSATAAGHRARALAAGAVAFLNKDAPLDDLADAVAGAPDRASAAPRMKLLEAGA
jgi:DNA-binding NarL/FixJ family response regulator